MESVVVGDFGVSLGRTSERRGARQHAHGTRGDVERHQGS